MKDICRKVAIITDNPGWHGEQLKISLKDRGINCRYLSLTDCLIEITGNTDDIKLPGFKELPLGVFVRGIPGGSLEQVIFRLDLLHGLYDSGVTIYNSPKSIEKTVDKPLTSILLSRAGLPTPKTWICETIDQANKILEMLGLSAIEGPLQLAETIGIATPEQLDYIRQKWKKY